MTQTDNDALADLIEARILHVADDAVDVALDVNDWQVILAALRSPAPVVDGKLLAHFTRMQEAAANYVEPTTYVARHPVDSGTGLCKWNTEFPMPEPTHAPEAVLSINARRDQAFINDMIYMLDGPEQREAQTEATRPQPAQDEAFAWVDDLSWHQQAKRAVMASVKLGSWMSAALDDVAVCEAMKADIREWFSAGEPMEILTAAITALRQHSGESALREALEPFASFADTFVDAEGWTNSMRRERIVDWFGPSDFRKARAALGGGGEA